jgi:NDP-sugar pyrophosphorylase family protein
MNDKILSISEYVTGFEVTFPDLKNEEPWFVTKNLEASILEKIKKLGDDFKIENNIAIHKTAIVETGVIIKSASIISEGCFIGAHAYLRGGVYLGEKTSVGPGCEIKSSVILDQSALAHFNFVGDSIVGSFINMEAGAILANHFNERKNKTISINIGGESFQIDSEKFGSLIGDHTKIGANAVLSPGTILLPHTIVKRLELIDQN